MPWKSWTRHVPTFHCFGASVPTQEDGLPKKSTLKSLSERRVPPLAGPYFSVFFSQHEIPGGTSSF